MLPLKDDFSVFFLVLKSLILSLKRFLQTQVKHEVVACNKRKQQEHKLCNRRTFSGSKVANSCESSIDYKTRYKSRITSPGS